MMEFEQQENPHEAKIVHVSMLLLGGFFVL